MATRSGTGRKGPDLSTWVLGGSRDLEQSCFEGFSAEIGSISAEIGSISAEIGSISAEIGSISAVIVVDVITLVSMLHLESFGHLFYIMIMYQKPTHNDLFILYSRLLG
ncbi:hypothetical protein OROHE_018871 [Orobanche hederae]